MQGDIIFSPFELASSALHQSGVSLPPMSEGAHLSACARLALGLAYQQGTLDVVQDRARGFAHIWHAALQGFGPALNHLGGCYQLGLGVAINLDAAALAYILAIGQKVPQASKNLQACLQNPHAVNYASFDERQVNITNSTAPKRHTIAKTRNTLVPWMHQAQRADSPAYLPLYQLRYKLSRVGMMVQSSAREHAKSRHL